MNQRLNWRDVDWLLLLVVLILVAFGITMVYSATFTTEDLSDYWLRQLVFALIGLTGLVIMALFDYRHLELLAPPSFILFVMLLVAVFLFGDTRGRVSTLAQHRRHFAQPTERASSPRSSSWRY